MIYLSEDLRIGHVDRNMKRLCYLVPWFSVNLIASYANRQFICIFFWNLTTTHLHQYEFNRRRRSTWIYLFSCQCSFVSPIVHRFYSNKWDNRKQFYFNPNLVLRPTSFSIRFQHFNWLVHFYPIFQLSIFFGFTMEL